MKFIVTVTGPSGSGKSTLVKKLVATGEFEEVVSTTTRTPRSGERDGVDYHFVSVEDFQTIDLLERIEYNGALYGASRQAFQEAFDSGRTPIIVVDPSGMIQINRYLRESDSEWYPFNIYIDCPLEVQYHRLLERLLADYRKVMAQGDSSDYAKFMDQYTGRLIQMTLDEKEWSDLFEGHACSSNLVFDRFDRDNEQEVMENIQRLISLYPKD